MIHFKIKTYENKFHRSMVVTARKAVDKGLKAAVKQLKVNIGLKCHSLEDLAQMDHPYATRHGGTTQAPHNPYWLVHRQSGGMFREGIMEPLMMETDDSVVGNFGLKDQPPARYVVYGTSKMIPRPVVWGTLGHAKPVIKKIFLDEFGKRFTGNVGLSIGAV